MRRPLVASLNHAWRGFLLVFRTERNIRTHAVCACVALILALLLRFNAIEIALVVIVSALVITGELFNAALERYSDIIKPRVSGYVENVKDIMAAGVLVLAGMALCVGLLLYTPKIIAFFLNRI